MCTGTTWFAIVSRMARVESVIELHRKDAQPSKGCECTGVVSQTFEVATGCVWFTGARRHSVLQAAANFLRERNAVQRERNIPIMVTVLVDARYL